MSAADEERERIADDASQRFRFDASKLLRLIFAAVLAVLGAVQVGHCVPEICANTLDDDGTGGDAACSGIDDDHDGYASVADGGNDCDDTDFQVIPGHYYPCNAGTGANTGTRLCQSNGTWGTCTANSVTPLCEATGSGVCKYIDCANGNDSTGDGSYGNPWKSFKCLGAFETGGTAPGCNIDPNPGSVVYLKGSGTCTDSYDPDGGSNPRAINILYLNASRSGTSTNRLVFKRYPGGTASITCPGVWTSGNNSAETGTFGFCVQMENAAFVDFIDLDMGNGWGSILYANPADDLRVLRNYFHDEDGKADNNVAAMNSAASVRVEMSHNRIKDIQDTHRTDEFTTNVSGAVFFNDQFGGDHKFNWNRVWCTQAPGAPNRRCGSCVKWKHGAKSVAQGGMSVGNEMRGNICWNTENCLIANTSSMNVHGNLCYDALQYCFRFEEGNGNYNVLQDAHLHHNTCVNAHLANVSFENYAHSPYGPFVFTDNVNFDDTAFAGDTFGISIDQYGSDTEYGYLYPSNLTLNRNLLWNSTTSGYKWGLFAAVSGDGGHGPAGNAGTNTTNLTTWRGLGFEANGAVENPTLSTDGSFTATSTNASGKGWRTESLDAPPTPEPTPTPTPNPAKPRIRKRILKR